MNYVIGLVGPSGSGKTAIILDSLKLLGNKAGILKSTSTRHKRSNQDDLFYDLISPEEFQVLEWQNAFADIVHYAGHSYGYERAKIEQRLKQKHLLCAMVEEAVVTLRRENYPLKVVKISPWKQKVYRGIERLSEDLERASRFKINYDLEIVNSFEPGGLEKATQQLVDYVQSLN